MEPTLIYNNTTRPMSKLYSTPPPLVQDEQILIKDRSSERKGSSFPSRKQDPSPDFARKGPGPTSVIEKDREDDIEEDEEESEFKMGRLIRQASIDSSHKSTPQQTTKVMTGCTSLPRYLSQAPESNQEKIMKMRKFGSMNEIHRKKSLKKIGKNINGGAPTIPAGGWGDMGSSEDMKEQIKFWARSVAFNLHQDC